MFHYVPMLILGLQGMPRRYYDYLPQYETGNFLAGFGAYLMVFGIVIMFVNLLMSFRKGGPRARRSRGAGRLSNGRYPRRRRFIILSITRRSWIFLTILQG